MLIILCGLDWTGWKLAVPPPGAGKVTIQQTNDQGRTKLRAVYIGSEVVVYRGLYIGGET